MIVLKLKYYFNIIVNSKIIVKTFSRFALSRFKRSKLAFFIVNVWVTADTSEVEKTDDLNDTVDYAKIIAIVKEQMAIRSDMIEHPTKRIVDAILPLNKVQKVKVEVEKIQPPINASFDKISVTIKAEQN